MTTRLTTLLIALSLTGALACDPSPHVARAAGNEDLKARRGYVVDSMLPMDEMLGRFRSDLGAPTVHLGTGAADSREALVRGFVEALTGQDSAALGAMHIDRAEFAWLWFPASKFATAPYELPPDYLWFQMTAESNKGISRALRLFDGGGRYAAHDCASAPVEQGGNRLWERCEVRWVAGDGTEERFRLFGSIIEREGRFKFVSYANPL